MLISFGFWWMDFAVVGLCCVSSVCGLVTSLVVNTVCAFSLVVCGFVIVGVG